MKILYAASEALPFVKTGGLADVAQALPSMLARGSHDVRLVLPAYRGTKERLPNAKPLVNVQIYAQRFTVWEGELAPNLKAWLFDCPALFAREGGIYTDAAGNEHADNAWRYGSWCRAIAEVALGMAGWTPDIVHLNDWHTGLAAYWLARHMNRPRIVLSIHNLAYQGRYTRADYDALGLPDDLWNPSDMEFHGGFSFLKAGLVYADALTTVSPTYAREIQTPAFGEDMEGVLQNRTAVLTGIANGIDTHAWNPATDPHIAQRYDATTVVKGKAANKFALQEAFGLEPDANVPIAGFVGRLAHQKGAELILECGSWFAAAGMQLVMLGAGDPKLERAFTEWGARERGRIGVRIGYDEAMAHRIEAGADFFLMPSRYEPCGLNQMYSQRYGTIPVVRRCGGLADTVIDATPQTLADGTATGVLFNDADRGGLLYGLTRTRELRRNNGHWSSMQQAGMKRDFGWREPASKYLQLYQKLLA